MFCGMQVLRGQPANARVHILSKPTCSSTSIMLKLANRLFSTKKRHSPSRLTQHNPYFLPDEIIFEIALYVDATSTTDVLSMSRCVSSARQYPYLLGVLTASSLRTSISFLLPLYTSTSWYGVIRMLNKSPLLFPAGPISHKSYGASCMKTSDQSRFSTGFVPLITC